MSEVNKALSEEAGQEIVNTLRALYGAGLNIEGLQVQLINGQATPKIIASVDIPVASASANGAMLSTDKTKLDGIEDGANKTIVDNALSASSSNPVQNKIVKAELDKKAASSHAHTASQVTGLTASRALVSDADGHPVASAVTATELGYLDGVTSSIQTQFGTKAPLASPTFTGTPKSTTPAASDNSTRIATTAFVVSAISAAVTGSMQYKGAAASYAAITGTDYKVGWYWVVSTAGTFAGQSCEVGDMVVANTDKGTAASNDHFDIIQSNIDYVTADDVKTWFA